jgi:hypothetical protein
LALALIATGTVIVLIADLLFKYWPASPPGRQVAATGIKANPPAAGNGATGISNPSLPMKAALLPKPQTAGENGAAPPANAAPDPQIAPALGSARRLMEAGHIAEARKMLLQPGGGMVPAMARHRRSKWHGHGRGKAQAAYRRDAVM